MKKHLRYRLMAMMLLLILLIVVFVGVMLFTNISADYNRRFYDEMAELQTQIEYSQVNIGNIPDLIDFLPQQDSLNPLITDRAYYILRGEVVVYSSINGGSIKKTANLRGVLDGGTNREIGPFGKTLDFAWTLRASHHTLYIVDYRTELGASMRNYILLFTQALLIGIGLAVLLSFVFARRFLIPIQRLTESAGAMHRMGEFKQLPSNARDEVGELTRVFNEMGIRITRNIQMLEDLLRNIPKPVFAVNANGIIVHSNEAFKRLFDQPPLQYHFLQQHRQESRFLTMLGDRYYYVYRSLFLLADGTEGTIFLLDDITEAERLENERKQFVADVSHELKTPLTVIKSYSETILENDDLDTATRTRFLKTVERSADQMNATVNQLLELSKSENAPPSAKEPLDLVDALKEIVEAMQLELEKKELTCLIEAPEERTLLCEPDQLRRVMINLLSNSIKYSNPGGRITASIRETEGGVLFAVEDEGIGIERQHLPHIFDKFYRVDKARSRATGGTGLGLSIVHSIVTGMGGTVEVESTFGEGSTFTCFFPD